MEILLTQRVKFLLQNISLREEKLAMLKRKDGGNLRKSHTSSPRMERHAVDVIYEIYVQLRQQIPNKHLQHISSSKLCVCSSSPRDENLIIVCHFGADGCDGLLCTQGV